MAKSGVDSDNEDKETSQECEINTQEPTNSTTHSTYAICKPMKTSAPTSILIESLVKNLCSLYEPDDKKATHIYNLICSKLHEMKFVDESYKMMEFEGMRHQYQRALYHLVTLAIGGKKPIPSLQAFWHNTDITKEWSHYQQEFDEIEYIAGGGFGQVYRVKHKLDGTEYAMKKIYIRSEGIKSISAYLSEAKTFACLNHFNVVQYKGAWLEMGAPPNKNAIEKEWEDDYTEQTDDNSKIEVQGESYIYPKAISETETFCNYRDDLDNSDFEISFENSAKLQYYSRSSNNVLEIDRKSIRRSRTKRNSISEGGNAICKIEEIQNLHIQAKNNLNWATLYIQMALCQSTLKQWLEKRNDALRSRNCANSALVSYSLNQVQTDTVVEILKQILGGIEYIHRKNIVHHDIKPSNIFVQIENSQLLVQLGDFGLACPLQSVKHSLALGTKLYAAPEQLSGECNPMSDMYSLGIVLFELVETFSTDMERVHLITELRKGNIPTHISIQQPQLADIIGQLVVRYPSKRPDAASLLQKITVNVSKLVQDLQCQLAQKDDEITRLKEMLKNAGLNNV